MIMGLFDKKTEEKKEKVVKKTSTLKKLSAKESLLAARFLSRPRVTEKSYTLNALNQYVFVVNKTATKKIVKQAVEEAYGVNVKDVRIIRLPAKKRVTGKYVGSKSAIKKAIVSIAKGQTLEILKSGI
jgi:large subunit ribosomal protein L23